jgi:signal transduction histidine kinase
VIPGVLLALALLSVVLGAAVMARLPHTLPRLTFALGMAAFAIEALCDWGLLALSGTPESHASWLTAAQAAGLLVPAPWCVFAFASARQASAPVPRPWQWSLTAGSLALAVTAAIGLRVPALEVPGQTGPFDVATLTGWGQWSIAVEIVATVAVLYGLEPSLRNSYGATRWKLKYLALGLVAVFVIRFYLLSQLLLFRALTTESIATGAVVTLVSLLLVAAGLARTQVLGTNLSVSRHFVYRSFVVGIAGGYLILAGAAGWLMNTLGIPDKVFWGTVVLSVGAIAVAALLLSEMLRWRVKRYISRHFYAEKYDYRQQWRTFTQSLGTRVTLDSLVSQLLRSVTETFGTTRVALYLEDELEPGTLRLTASLGTGRIPTAMSPRLADFESANAGPVAAPVAVLGEAAAGSLAASGLVVAVPLPSQGQLIGALLIGSERDDTPYDPEDLDLMATVGEQAASAIATARLSERLAQTRAFDTFSRLTSFVVHDLKNSISALSLLSQNARQYMADPEFQRDAVKTLGFTVSRMQRLLGRLANRQVADALELEPLDLAELARETADAQLAGSRVRLRVEPGEAPMALADRELVQRILQNLITNAVEAMEGEGEIVVRVQARERFIACAISDTGCGMSEEFIRTSLFVPFQTTKKGGWGIGLYQARETLAGLGGRIEVTSQEGRGTTMTILLPAARA